MPSLDAEFPTLASARRELRADLLERRSVERCAERAADLGLLADAEVFARALASLPQARALLGRSALPAGMLSVDDGHLLVDRKRLARVWAVGQEGVVVERLPAYQALPDVLLACALAAPVLPDAGPPPDEIAPVGIAFLDSDRLFWSRGADDWHLDHRAGADVIVSAARFFPGDDTRALLVRAIEKEPGDRRAFSWLKELVAADLRGGRHRAALRALQILHRCDPRDPDILEMIAASFEAAGAADRAKALADQAKRIRSAAR